MGVLEGLRMAVVGHVDHGKSTLIGRLLLETNSLSDEKLVELKGLSVNRGQELAYLVDQLKEEREENKTIDTTETFLKTKRRRICLIDTPGHVEFIKNMMTGATRADAALLVIDVKDGIQEQTRRHVVFLRSVGVEKIVVCVNKMDSVDFDEAIFRKVEAEISLFLSRLSVEPVAILPVSARQGANISKKSALLSWFSGPVLLKTLESLRRPSENRRAPLRLPVQDIYFQGSKALCVGQVESGCILRKQNVFILPGARETKVISIKTFKREKKVACQGENIGFVLKRSPGIRRGDIVCQKAGAPVPKDHFSAIIFWLSSQALEKDKKMTLRCATQETGCWCERIAERIDSSAFEILEAGAKNLNIHELGKVILRTEEPVVVEPFDFIRALGRFVLESDGSVCGVGIVHDPADLL